MINSNLGGNILTYNESEDTYYIQYGADSVPKKLGSALEDVTHNFNLISYSTTEGYISIPNAGYKYVTVTPTHFVYGTSSGNLLYLYGENTRLKTFYASSNGGSAASATYDISEYSYIKLGIIRNNGTDGAVRGTYTLHN